VERELHNDILDFLDDYKTNKEIKEEFGLSHTRARSSLSWLQKLKKISVSSFKLQSRKGVMTFYKKI
jgi:hypothetical protein